MRSKDARPKQEQGRKRHLGSTGVGSYKKGSALAFVKIYVKDRDVDPVPTELPRHQVGLGGGGGVRRSKKWVENGTDRGRSPRRGGRLGCPSERLKDEYKSPSSVKKSARVRQGTKGGQVQDVVRRRRLREGGQGRRPSRGGKKSSTPGKNPVPNDLQTKGSHPVRRLRG